MVLSKTLVLKVIYIDISPFLDKTKTYQKFISQCKNMYAVTEHLVAGAHYGALITN